MRTKKQQNFTEIEIDLFGFSSSERILSYLLHLGLSLNNRPYLIKLNERMSVNGNENFSIVC